MHYMAGGLLVSLIFFSEQLLLSVMNLRMLNYTYLFLSTGKMITAAYVPLPTYHNLFPDSMTATQLLVPSRR